MSSSSSSPLELFEGLTIDPHMSPTSVEVRSRAIEIRDVLSSFDRDILPAEFKPQIFSELDRPFQSRPPVSQWTIQEDLLATLLQWGAYNDQAYELLSSLQSGSTLARCFHEKLGRRFRTLFEEYDRLPEGDAQVRRDIARIAQGFRDIVEAVKDDCPYRELGQEAIARRLLEAMIDVCRRHVDVVSASETPVTPRRGTRRSTTSSVDGPLNLFEALIKIPGEDQTEAAFMLDLLEIFPSSIFVTLQPEHTNLTSLLDINNAPSAYKYRVGRLPSRPESAVAQTGATGSRPQGRASHIASTRSDATSATSPTSPPAEAQAQTQPQTTSAIGSKRSAEDATPTTRRGKKKTTR